MSFALYLDLPGLEADGNFEPPYIEQRTLYTCSNSSTTTLTTSHRLSISYDIFGASKRAVSQGLQ